MNKFIVMQRWSDLHVPEIFADCGFVAGRKPKELDIRRVGHACLNNELDYDVSGVFRYSRLYDAKKFVELYIKKHHARFNTDPSTWPQFKVVEVAWNAETDTIAFDPFMPEGVKLLNEAKNFLREDQSNKWRTFAAVDFQL